MEVTITHKRALKLGLEMGLVNLGLRSGIYINIYSIKFSSVLSNSAPTLSTLLILLVKNELKFTRKKMSSHKLVH